MVRYVEGPNTCAEAYGMEATKLSRTFRIPL